MRITPTAAWILLFYLSHAFGHGYTGDFDGWYQPVPHGPVDIITDVVNDLGVRILQQYTPYGNVAFSPMGVAFVLAALYEGSRDRSSHQISESLGLPRNRDITRIGFRDIHRRLRTYLNADGFLGGLTLNQENTRLRAEYEDVLRFYGFDLSMDEERRNTTSSAPDITTAIPSSEETVTEADATSDVPGSTTPSTTAQLTDAGESSSEEASNSTSSPVEMLGVTLSTVNLQDRLTESTTAPSTSAPVDATDAGRTIGETNFETTGQTSASTTEIPATTMPGTFSMETSTSATPVTLGDNSITTVTSVPVETTTLDSSRVKSTDVTTSSVDSKDENMISTLEASSTESSSSSRIESSSIPDEVVTESMTSSVMMNSLAEGETEEMSSASTSATTSINSDEDTTSLIDNSTRSSTGPPADENTVSTDLSANETISESSGEMGSSDLPSTMAMIGGVASNTEDRQPETTLSPSANDESMNRVRRRSVRSPRGYFSSYPDEGIWMQDLGIWKPFTPSLSEASVRDSTEISFLVNGCDVSSISATTYSAVLPFAYFPSLHAVALEFPLDDPRYNILLMMSTNRRDTYRLARDLGGKSLRLLRKQLQPTWVRAIIPSFMLRGFVTLTPFLERLGIVDVFEPRAADLSPMTPDGGVYVRDVQQSIGVNIRNYMKPDRTHSRNGLFERAEPVPFTVVHPFLYFIVDTETSVALIAGRVNDPLNSRIL